MGRERGGKERSETWEEMAGPCVSIMIHDELKTLYEICGC
jgi:hypothetical protein